MDCHHPLSCALGTILGKYNLADNRSKSCARCGEVLAPPPPPIHQAHTPLAPLTTPQAVAVWPNECPGIPQVVLFLTLCPPPPFCNPPPAEENFSLGDTGTGVGGDRHLVTPPPPKGGGTA